ncbi:BA75_05068T0 [Komagataella pastoris]|uniref:BA75_05068T0 n=1 Tax=Komagataella pastoris TaxID=4922 RepID=A0A1B2JHY6_PICPA|nr:BA75_05068T0 [Komagataella pastoris]
MTTLPPQQIFEFKRQIQQEVQHLQSSIQALNTAKAKFNECITNVDRVSKSPENDILTPLTSSLYVPGRIVDNDKFLVDVGTGYYVEKGVEDAKEFYKLRIDKLNQDSEQLTQMIQEKLNIMQSVDNVLKQKIQQEEKSRQQTTPA